MAKSNLALAQTYEEQVEQERFLCRNDRKYLCRDVLGFQDWDVCHDDLAAFLRNSKLRFKLILVPREHLKTSIITIGESIRLMLDNPNISILYANATYGNAASFLSQTKELLESKSTLAKTFGQFQGAKWNSDGLTVAQRTISDKTPTFSAAGADQAVTSQHYDVIFLDDIVNRQTITTPEQIKKTWKFYSDCMDLLKKPNGLLFVVGTRWDDKDLYGHIINEEKQLAESGRPPTFDIYVRKAMEGGKVIFPKKFTPEILEDLRFKKGSYEFSCQYMNEPVSREDQHFKPPVRYWNTVPEDATRFITVDLAGDDEDADYNVVTAGAFSKANQLYVLEYKRGRFKPDEVIKHVFDLVEKHKPLAVGVESIAYQRIFIHLLDLEMRRRDQFFTVYPIKPHTDKFQRLLSLQPIWERGDLLLKPGMVELEDEFDRFPRGMNDDILDTIEMQMHMVNATIPSQPARVEAHDYLKEKDFTSYREWQRVQEQRSGEGQGGVASRVARIGT